MIQANDLRIGNFVKYAIAQDDYYFPVESILAEGINRQEHFGEDGQNDSVDIIEYSDLAGIPLDEGWLKRLGFEDEDREENGIWYYSFFTLWGKMLEWNKEKGMCINMAENEFYRDLQPIDCKYVHQLQNLYYALTGSELAIREEAGK